MVHEKKIHASTARVHRNVGPCGSEHDVGPSGILRPHRRSGPRRIHGRAYAQDDRHIQGPYVLAR